MVAEVVQVHVAGVAFVPDRADADLRLVEVVRLQAGRDEHRLARAWLAGWVMRLEYLLSFPFVGGRRDRVGGLRRWFRGRLSETSC